MRASRLFRLLRKVAGSDPNLVVGLAHLGGEGLRLAAYLFALWKRQAGPLRTQQGSISRGSSGQGIPGIPAGIKAIFPAPTLLLSILKGDGHLDYHVGCFVASQLSSLISMDYVPLLPPTANYNLRNSWVYGFMQLHHDAWYSASTLMRITITMSMQTGPQIGTIGRLYPNLQPAGMDKSGSRIVCPVWGGGITEARRT